MDKINIQDLNPADYNPRVMYDYELEHLRNSIESFGLVDPIIINLKNNRIIGGHQRYKILKEQNPTLDLHLFKLGGIGWAFPNTNLTISSEDSEKALNIALNKISGGWDNPKLESILEDFSKKGFNIDLTGFEDLKNISDEFQLDDYIGGDDSSFFNTVFTNLDDIDDIDDEEIIIRESKSIIQCGDYKFSLNTSLFNHWISKIEKEHDFNLINVKNELMRMLKI